MQDAKLKLRTIWANKYKQKTRIEMQVALLICPFMLLVDTNIRIYQ